MPGKAQSAHPLAGWAFCMAVQVRLCPIAPPLGHIHPQAVTSMETRETLQELIHNGLAEHIASTLVQRMSLADCEEFLDDFYAERV